jgi:AGZA family xanthine/uracil permease-like MFS transporter
MQFLSRFFRFEERRTSLAGEFVAGTTTFLAMAYILFVNPSVLAAAGMDRTAVITVTCIVTAAATFLTGVLANTPVAMAPGMGLNAFFAYTLVLGQEVPWPTALGIVFLSGLFFFALTVLGIRQKIVEAIPRPLISAISVGIGLFITLIGAANLGLVVKNDVTIVSAGPMTPTVLTGLAGFAVMIFFEMKGIKGSMILGILAATGIALLTAKISVPGSIFTTEFNLSKTALKLDVGGALRSGYLTAIFTLMFMHLFDSIGTLVACANRAGLVDKKGNIQKLDRLLAIDAAAAMLGAALGTSTVTAYVESAAGIEEGGRTGMTSVVTAGWFVAALGFIPLIAIVPSYATAPALILVGFFMMREVSQIDFSELSEGLPAFVIIVMIALSYSISAGLAFGFLSYALFKAMTWRLHEIKPVLWVIIALSLAHFVL